MVTGLRRQPASSTSPELTEPSHLNEPNQAGYKKRWQMKRLFGNKSPGSRISLQIGKAAPGIRA
jgi:hypothetical protein